VFDYFCRDLKTLFYAIENEIENRFRNNRPGERIFMKPESLETTFPHSSESSNSTSIILQGFKRFVAAARVWSPDRFKNQAGALLRSSIQEYALWADLKK